MSESTKVCRDCKLCGKKLEVWESEICFSCSFWQGIIEEDKKSNPHEVAIIDGTHYRICDEDDDSYFRGFGGAKFVIKFFDGTEVTTTNLWCQGNIPERWKNQLQDNATFDYEWQKIGEINYLIKK